MNLQYSPAYHAHCSLKLDSGRTLTLVSLYQLLTYSGLLEGGAIKWLNDTLLKTALEDAKKTCLAEEQPILLPPDRRRHLDEPAEAVEARHRSPNLQPEWLPMVRCIAQFTSTPTVRATDHHQSALTVVWFQDDFAMPILEPASGQLRALDWDALAVDVYL